MKHLNTLLFICITALALAQTPVNTNISNAEVFDGEPYLVINPNNNQNLVAAWMAEKYANGSFKVAITIRSSFDGGNTWSAAVTIPHQEASYGSADVSMAYSKTGILYLSFIDFNQAANTGGDYITRSYDGGLTWDSATLVINSTEAPGKDPIDRPWLAVDNSNTANAGTLYITSKPAYWIPPPNRNYYKVSTDSGHTWSALANVDGGNYLVGNIIPQPMAAPTTTINGNFCAIYPSYLSSQNPLATYYQATSYNKGQSFNYSTVLSYSPVQPDSNLKSGYRVATNPADSNNLAFFLLDAKAGEADIYSVHSNDGGQTWSSMLRVNDDSPGSGKDHDMVWGAYNARGSLAATWRDRRNAGTTGFWNAGYDFYYALSTDNGATFSANKLLTSQFVTFDSVIADKGNDFMSCVYQDDTLYTVWGDTRSGTLNIFFTKTIASLDTTVGIVQLEGNQPQWGIFPNPAHDVLNIEVAPQMLGEQLSAADVTGKKIYTSIIQSQHLKLSTATWATGTYLIKAGNAIKKVVKQ